MKSATIRTILVACLLILLAQGPRPVAAAENSPYPVDDLTPLYEKAVRHILGQLAGPHKGYALVFGAGEGRLAHELLRQSEYRVLGAEPDEAKVHAGRLALDRADLYGDRITLQTESLDRLGYRDYAAAVVASDTILTEGRCPGSAAEMFRMVRPDGGVAILGQPAGCPQKLARDELTRWLDAAGLEYTITEDADGLWARIRRGPLPGSGEWTHVRADAANTASSGDMRMSDQFGVLWFGEPGPRIMVDRHWRNTSPLYKHGRLIIPARDRLVCSDAYNGARLWDLEIPNASRIAMMRDAGWLALGESHLFAAVENRCLRIDVADGRVVETLSTPDGKSDWGHVALDGNRLYGSQQPHNASHLAAFIGPGAEGNRLGRFDNQPIILSRSLFCRDTTSGELLWAYRPEAAIANVTITIGTDGLYFVATTAPKLVGETVARASLADFTEGENEYVIKLDKQTGKLLWRRQLELPYQHVMHLCRAGDVVLASGCRSFENDYWYHLRALRAADGSDAWQQDVPTQFGTRDKEHGKQDKHPMIVGGAVYLKQGSFDLATGRPLGFAFQTSNCAECSASGNHIFGRMSGVASTWNLAGDGSFLRLDPAMRPGCYTTIIPAGGLVMMPAFSAGCTCSHTIQTTIAWLPKSATKEKP